MVLGLGLGFWTYVNGGLKPRENNAQYMDDYSAEGEKLMNAMDKVVATAGGSELTNAQLQILYWSEVFSFLNNYSSYLSYFGLDLSKPLSEQMVADGITYQQYFLENALKNWHSYTVLANQAKAEGYTMSEEMQTQLEMTFESLAASASYYGFASVDELIRADMGEGASEARYKEYLELYFFSMDYFDSIYENATPDMATIEAYYNEHAADLGVTKESGKLVDVRHILVMPKGGTTDASGGTVYSDEEWETCRLAAQEILDQWLAGAADEAYFAELATLKTEDPGSQSTGGLYTDVYVGQMVAPFEEWCFDESRQPGDTGLVRTSYGYHVMYFVAGEEQWIRAARSGYLSEYCNGILDGALEANPMEVTYKNIRLGNVELS